MSAPTRPKLSIHPGLTDLTIGVAELALAAAERGIEGFYLPEHTHIPVDYDRSKYPGGGPMPERYKRILDPFISLSFVAATTDLDVGTVVSLIAQHDVVALAKAVATLDHLAGGGRFSLAAGAGWSTTEFETHHDVPASERADVVGEAAQVLRAIWTNDEASFHGKYYDVPPLWSWPKPDPASPIPIYFGGPPTARTFRRVAAWADGWVTMGVGVTEPAFVDAMRHARRVWEDAGRDPALFHVTALVPPAPIDELRRVTEAGQEHGVDHITVHLEDTAGDRLFQLLDDLGTICRDQPRNGPIRDAGPV